MIKLLYATVPDHLQCAFNYDLMEQIEFYKHNDALADFLLKQQLCFFSSNDQAVSIRCELG